MGVSQSRKSLDLSDSDYEDDPQCHHQEQTNPSNSKLSQTNKALDHLDTKLKALNLNYTSTQIPNSVNPVKRYLYMNGNTPNAKWILSEKLNSYIFIKTPKIELEEDDEDDETYKGSDEFWVLKVGFKVRARVSIDMQLKMFGDQRRVDFVQNGVWALKFFCGGEYKKFVSEFQDCLSENVYGLKASEENKVKVYGNEFLGWVKPEVAPPPLPTIIYMKGITVISSTKLTAL